MYVGEQKNNKKKTDQTLQNVGAILDSKSRLKFSTLMRINEHQTLYFINQAIKIK